MTTSFSGERSGPSEADVSFRAEIAPRLPDTETRPNPQSMIKGLESFHETFAKEGEAKPSFEGYADKLAALSDEHMKMVQGRIRSLSRECLRSDSAQPVSELLKFIDQVSALNSTESE